MSLSQSQSSNKMSDEDDSDEEEQRVVYGPEELQRLRKLMGGTVSLERNGICLKKTTAHARVRF